MKAYMKHSIFIARRAKNVVNYEATTSMSGFMQGIIISSKSFEGPCFQSRYVLEHAFVSAICLN